MTDRKKPGVAFWATVVVVVAIVGYPLSLFPIMWLDHRDMISKSTPLDTILWVYCAPVSWLRTDGPDWIDDAVDWIDDVTDR
jgi:hypothetical protein